MFDSIRYFFDNKRNRIILLVILLLILALLVAYFVRGQTQPVAAESGFEVMWVAYGLHAPHAVAVDGDGYVYVSNTGDANVKVYDSDGNEDRRLEMTVDEGDPPQFYSPYGIAVDDERDQIYIADYSWRGVRVVDKGGQLLYNLPRDPNDIKSVPGGADFVPYGVALLDDKVYISAKDGIYVFEADGGAFVKRIGNGQGADAGQFNFPNGIAADPDTDTIFVTDTLNRRIVALTSDGQVKWMLGTPDVAGQITSPFSLPRGITVKDGLLYISDTFAHEIMVLDEDGQLLAIMGERGTGDTQFNFPEGLASKSDRVLYIVDRGNNRVVAWQLAPDFEGSANPIAPSERKKFEDSLQTF
jgi:sugar lactone lactonase YvrE